MKNLSQKEIEDLASTVEQILKVTQVISDKSLHILFYELMLRFNQPDSTKQLKLPFKNKEKPMAMKKITGVAEIDAIANSLSKKFGGKEVISLGPKITKATPFSSGSLSLDCLMGIGGIPDDRIVEIFGPSSAGKTSLALQIASNYVKERGYDRPPLFYRSRKNYWP